MKWPRCSCVWTAIPMLTSPSIDRFIHWSIHPPIHSHIYPLTLPSICHPSIHLFSHQSPIQASSNPPIRPSICPSINLSIPYSESDTIMASRNQHKTRTRGRNTTEITTKGPLSVVFNMAWSSSLLKSHTDLWLRNFRWLRVSTLLSLVWQLPK